VKLRAVAQPQGWQSATGCEVKKGKEETAARHFGLEKLPTDNIVKDSGKLCREAGKKICCTAHDSVCSCC